MAQPRKWFLGLVPVAGLLLAAVLTRQGWVETDLTTRGTAELAASGMGWAKVGMAGRDAVLTGEAPNAELRGMAVDAAERVFGIRLVHDRMSVAARVAPPPPKPPEPAPRVQETPARPPEVAAKPEESTPPPIRPYLFNAVRGERDITLTGFVPDAAAREEILRQARRFFEGENVVDQLRIGPGAPNGFVNAVRGGLQDLSRLLPGGTLSLSDASIALRGLAPLDSARDQAIAAFRARAPQGYGSLVEVNTAPLPPTIAVFNECNLLFEDLLSRSRIQFAFASAVIEPESFGLLDRLVVVVRRCAGATVEIAGHTDSIGSDEVNQTLSENRAKSVVDYLAGAGVEANRVVARGFGATRPIASNETAEGRAQNRRIEFKVH